MLVDFVLNLLDFALSAMLVVSADEEDVNTGIEDHQLLSDWERFEQVYLVLKGVLDLEVSNKVLKIAEQNTRRVDLISDKQVV